MTLNRNVQDHHNENEQIAMGTGVLVDGLDFSDDKMLVGRTFSYSDTQRYRVGPNYLQLPVNQAKNARCTPTSAAGRCRTAWTSPPGRTRTSTTSPRSTAGSRRGAAQAEQPAGDPGRLTQSVIERRNDYVQPRARYCTMQDWERDDLVHNMIDLLGQCERDVQERMVWHFLLVHDDYGTRVGQGIGVSVEDVSSFSRSPARC
jgi:catalase